MERPRRAGRGASSRRACGWLALFRKLHASHSSRRVDSRRALAKAPSRRERALRPSPDLDVGWRERQRIAARSRGWSRVLSHREAVCVEPIAITDRYLRVVCRLSLLLFPRQALRQSLHERATRRRYFGSNDGGRAPATFPLEQELTGERRLKGANGARRILARVGQVGSWRETAMYAQQQEHRSTSWLRRRFESLRERPTDP